MTPIQSEKVTGRFYKAVRAELLSRLDEYNDADGFTREGSDAIAHRAMNEMLYELKREMLAVLEADEYPYDFTQAKTLSAEAQDPTV